MADKSDQIESDSLILVESQESKEAVYYVEQQNEIEAEKPYSSKLTLIFSIHDSPVSSVFIYTFCA